MIQTRSPAPLYAEAGGSQIEGLSVLQNEFKHSLGNLDPISKRIKQLTKGMGVCMNGRTSA